MDVQITDESVTKRICIVVFVPNKLPIIKIHFTDGIIREICYHEYYKQKMDDLSSNFFTSNFKIFGVNSGEKKIPTFFKTAPVCVDLYEYEGAGDRISRLYACATCFKNKTTYKLRQVDSNSIQLGVVTMNWLTSEIDHSPDFNALYQHFESKVQLYSTLHDSTHVSYIRDHLRSQFYSPLTQTTRVCNRVFTEHFVNHIKIPEIDVGVFQTTLTSIIKMVEWVRDRGYSQDTIHGMASNVYSSGFIQDALNCKDMSVTLYQLIKAAHKVGYFTNINPWFVGGKITQNDLPVAHMFLVTFTTDGRGVSSILDATRIDSNVSLTDDYYSFVSCMFAENESYWVKTNDCYGAYFKDFVAGNFKKEKKFLIVPDNNAFIIIKKDNKLEKIAYDYEQPLLKVKSLR